MHPPFQGQAILSAKKRDVLYLSALKSFKINSRIRVFEGIYSEPRRFSAQMNRPQARSRPKARRVHIRQNSGFGAGGPHGRGRRSPSAQSP